MHVFLAEVRTEGMDGDAVEEYFDLLSEVTEFKSILRSCSAWIKLDFRLFP
jgi:hypothetical protein